MCLIRADQNFSGKYFVLLTCSFIQKQFSKGNFLKNETSFFYFLNQYIDVALHFQRYKIPKIKHVIKLNRILGVTCHMYFLLFCIMEKSKSSSLRVDLSFGTFLLFQIWNSTTSLPHSRLMTTFLMVTCSCSFWCILKLHLADCAQCCCYPSLNMSIA